MIPESNLAGLDCLNVGEGDMKFTFDADDVQEVVRAERIVKDMLRRGYMLFVETDGKLARVLDFNPKTASYVIADGPEASPTPVSEDEPAVELKPEEKPAKKRGRPRKSEVPMKGAKTTSVPRSAGG